MNTCKAALRILKARKLYVIIYLVLIGTMMFSISWQIMRGSTAARATTYEPESARIAVIDRDDDAEHVAQSLRSYLALDGEMVTIDDDSISLQQAVASNYVDLIAIVPQGFAERYLQYADNATATQPTIDTVVSYASGAGSLAQLKVNEFLSLTRTAYLGMPQAQRTLDAAMATTLDAATADMKQSHIAVVSSDSEDDGTTPGSSAFAGTLKTGLYPLLLVMPVCTFLVVSIQRQRNPPQALLVPRASGVVGSAANADMRDVRSAGMCCVYRGDIPVDGAGRSVLYRPECRERRLVVRVADSCWGHPVSMKWQRTVSSMCSLCWSCSLPVWRSPWI